MKEKHSKSKHKKKHRHKSKKERKSETSNSSESDEWVEQKTVQQTNVNKHEDWMSMTGMLKTFTKDDIQSKQKEREKKQLDSYNPSTSSRELNPYWKDGGTGLPESYRKSQSFMRPSDDDDYYSKSKSSDYQQPKQHDNYHERNRDKQVKTDYDLHSDRKSYNWKKSSESSDTLNKSQVLREHHPTQELKTENKKKKDNMYLDDEKMNKLAAKIVKAEIMGDTKLVAELKTKLEAAREYRKQNPNAGKAEDTNEAVMLMSTSSTGNSRPLTKDTQGDPRSKGGKRKADTHNAGQRTKYFGNDDKYDLAQMFQQEKYGTNYEDEAQLANIAAKNKNPNDDLEDIFMDEISKNRSAAKDSERERQRAINQHVKMERSLEGCEYCLDSKNMLKHLMVSCGNKVYLALPAKKSLIKGQCIITTIQHNTCVTSLDEDVWEEIMNYRKALTQFYNSQNKDVVFFETATRLYKFPHMVINCIPLPRDVGDTAPIYFKKALLECEAEWSMNKKVIDLKGKNIRKGVPKGLPYFWIDFGMDPGFAHVIEDQKLFPKTFAEEIIGGILDLDHNSWKNPQKEYGDLQRKKVLEFINEWKPYDITEKK